MQHHRGSSGDDWNELLKSFAHRGAPAALEAQLPEAKPKPRLRRRDAAFHLNQGLFDASQT